MHLFLVRTSIKQTEDKRKVAEAGTDGLEDTPERRLLSGNLKREAGQDAEAGRNHVIVQ